jgi:FtsZ-binding cell division protein ZapB
VESHTFDQLEAKIRKVIDMYVQLKQRTGELEELVRTRDRELREATAAVRALKEEKEAVKGRIDSLLEKLDHLDDSQ